ncbi:MAG: hypothetical protein ACR2OR_08980 [Hyphomicrobiales bacterium]
MSDLIFEHITLLFLTFLIGIAAGFIAKLLFRQKRQRQEPILPEKEEAFEAAEADDGIDEAEFQPEETAKAGDEASEEEFEYETEAFGLEEPRSGKSDNLTKIRGIGAKTQELLNELGVFHFDQIAGWSAVEVTAVDEMLPFRGQIERGNWVGQAKELAGIAPEVDNDKSEPEEEKG